MNASIAAIVNSKGGTGKTTFAANTAAMLAEIGQQRVLLIDSDKQPTLSSIYPLSKQAPGGLCSLLQDEHTADNIAAQCISTTNVPGLDVIVSDHPKGDLDAWIQGRVDGRLRMRMAITLLADRYDHIVIDTMGAVGSIQESAIVAATRVISPLPPTTLNAREYGRGTLNMLANTATVLSMMAIPLPPVSVVPYMVDRTLDAQDIMGYVRSGQFASAYKGDFRVTTAAIPTYVAYREAARGRVPVHQLPLAQGRKATVALANVVAELFPSAAVTLAALREEAA